MSQPFNPFLRPAKSQAPPPTAAPAFNPQNSQPIANNYIQPNSQPVAFFPSTAPPTTMGYPPQSMYPPPPTSTVDQLNNNFQKMSISSMPPPPPSMDAAPVPSTAPGTNAYSGISSTRYQVPTGAYQYASGQADLSSYTPPPTETAPIQQQTYSQMAANMAVTNPLAEPAVEYDNGQQPDEKFVKFSMNCCPNSTAMSSGTGITFGSVFRPLAPQDYDNEIPVIPYGTDGIQRCMKCRAYMNPFANFIDNGRQWKCNFCGHINDVPTSYYCHLDASGQRVDRLTRPELAKGQVEYEASSEYCLRPPQSPSYLFMIDVSYQSITSGMLLVVCQSIQDCLEDMRYKGGEGIPTYFGLITYDTTVHFYAFGAKSGVKVYTVGDIDEPFLPVPTSLMVSIDEYYNEITRLLTALPQMYADTRIVDSCLGSALLFADKVIEDIGGKLLIFQSCLPSLGKGKLRNRESATVYGTDAEKDLLASTEESYKEIAQQFAAIKQVSVDLYIASSQYMDIANLSVLPRLSGGQLYYYPSFNSGNNMSECLYNDILRNIRRETGWEAVFRVRVGQGATISEYHGNFFLRSTDLMSAPVPTADSVYVLEFKIESLINTPSLCVQSALLYTNSSKQRRIRVHTAALPVYSLLNQLYTKINCDVFVNIIFRQAIQHEYISGPSLTRQKIHQVILNVINKYAPYRDMNDMNYLPECLALLPLYIMSLQKHPAYRGGTDNRSDMRSFLLNQILVLSNENISIQLYPRLMCISTMIPECCTCLSDDTPVPEGYTSLSPDNFLLPPITSLSINSIVPQYTYLLDDGLNFYLFIGPQSDTTIYQELFGIPSAEGLDLSQVFFPVLETELNHKVHALLDRLRIDRPYFTPLYIIRQNEPLYMKFIQRLIEDRDSFPGGTFSYQEYVNLVSGGIQQKY
ncbi:hypothetical protein WA158_000328 [Blastocystis sp. Blastoise]